MTINALAVPAEEALADPDGWVAFDAVTAATGLSEAFIRRAFHVGASLDIQQRPGRGEGVIADDVFEALVQVMPPSVYEHRGVKATAGALEKARKSVADAHGLVRVIRAKRAAAQREAAKSTDEKSVAVAQKLAAELASVEMGCAIAEERFAEARAQFGRALEIAAADIEAALQEESARAAKAWARALRSGEKAYREYAAASHELRRFGVHAPSAPLIPAGDFVTVLERSRDGHVARLAAEQGVA